MTVLALATCWVPGLGVVFSGPAFLLTRRRRGGYRNAAVVALGVSLVGILGFVCLILVASLLP